MRGIDLFARVIAYLHPQPGKGGLGSLPQPPPLLQQHKRRSMGRRQPQPQILSIILLTQPQPPQQIIKSMISNQRLQLSFKKPKQFIKILLENIFDRCVLLSLHITPPRKKLLRVFLSDRVNDRIAGGDGVYAPLSLA